MLKEKIGNTEVYLDRPLNVIALDDLQDQVDLIEIQLTAEYKDFYGSVDHATTVAGLYDIARKYRQEGKPCDAIILDFNLPKMTEDSIDYNENGYVVAQNLRLDPHLKNTPIILLTAYEPEYHTELGEVLKMNNVYYLRKDGSAEKLHKTIIKAVIDNRKAA